MRPIDEMAKVVRRPVKMRGREPLHTVIAPSESARKFGDRHDLQNSDTGFGKLRQFLLGAPPGALWGEGANVHLVNYLVRECDTWPIPVSPSEGSRVDNLR